MTKFLGSIGHQFPRETGEWTMLIFGYDGGRHHKEDVVVARCIVRDDLRGGEGPGRYGVYAFDIPRFRLVLGHLVAFNLSDEFFVAKRKDYLPRGVLEWWPEEAVLERVVRGHSAWFESYGRLDLAVEATGVSRRKIEAGLTSRDPMKRALAFEVLARYFGWAGFDNEPTYMTRKELLSIYGGYLEKAAE